MRGDGLHVEHHGEAGRAIVLAHGFGGSARNWRPQVRALRERFRVTTYDAVGHARSAAPESPEAFAMDAAVATLGGLIAETGDPHPIVGGLSMGAAVALEWALRNPAVPAALTLASLPAGPDSGRGISAQAAPFADAIDRDGLEAAGERFAWGPGSGLDERGRALVRQGFLEHTPRALAHTLRELLARLPGPEQFRDRLAGFPAPVLIVAGDRDAPSVDAGRTLAAASDRIAFEIIPDAGHVVNLAQPAAYNACVLEWLDGRVAPSDSSPTRSS
jgi:2-succinyl-6-hydroxy-2,4-cyclohexadiene-1-carboxylate synthase